MYSTHRNILFHSAYYRISALFLLLCCTSIFERSEAFSTIHARTSSEFSREDTIQEIEVINTRIRVQQQTITSPVSAFALRKIENEQRLNYKEFSALVPNLYVPDYGSRMTSSIYVRGLGARIDNPVMGMYIDGIGLANKNSYDFSLEDVRSVRVYRGPQGSLFGRNTIGGVMVLETLSPLEWQGTRASVGYGNANTIEVKAGQYIKVQSDKVQSDKVPNDEVQSDKVQSDKVQGFAINAYYRHSDGHFTNTFNGEKADRIDESGVRIKYDVSKIKQSTTSTEKAEKENDKLQITAAYNYIGQSGFPYHAPEKPVSHNDPCEYTRHSAQIGLTYLLHFDKMNLSGTTAWQMLYDRMNMDQDYTPLPYFTLQQQQRVHNISQELALTPEKNLCFGNGYSWYGITGLSLAYTHNRMSAPVHFKQIGIDSLILKNANNGIHSAGFADNINIALQENNFVINAAFLTQQVEAGIYHSSFLTFKNVQLEAGLRLNYEFQHFIYASDATIHYTIENVLQNYRPIHSHISGVTTLPSFEVLPRLAVRYNFPHEGSADSPLGSSPSHNSRERLRTFNSIFASVSEGYKAGGFNTQLFSDILQNKMMSDMMSDMGVHFAQESEYTVSDVITYRPERCLNFEVGWSGDIRYDDDLRLNGNITLYELEVFNQQLTTFPERGTGRLMTNAGHSRSMGGEAQGNLGWKNLTLNITYGYTHAFFTHYNNGRNDYAGKNIPYVPAHTLNAGIDYRFIFNNSFFHSLLLNLNTQAFGQIYWNEENTETQPFYALLNANIVLQMKYITLSLWGKNLTNTQYNVFRFVSMGNTFMQSGKPITFGAKLSLEI